MQSSPIRKILYAGDLRYGTTSRERMDSLIELGFEVLPFDIGPVYASYHRVWRSLAWRVQIGPIIERANETIKHLASKEKYDFVWIDKGTWLSSETLTQLRERSQAKLALHYTPDAAFYSNKSRLFKKSIPHYNLCVTTKPFELQMYRAAKAQRTLMVLQGYSRSFDHIQTRRTQESSKACDVIFVGHRQTHYEKCLKAIAKSGIDIEIHGAQWVNFTKNANWACDHVKSNGLWGFDYALALSAARIGIGLLSKYIPETTTTRTFEIPASGSLLLAERTEDHLSLFEENEEAVYWITPDELIDKAKYYLKNEALRARIAAAGRARCVSSSYGVKQQLSIILKSLDIYLPLK
jgi:spore maturation protein CgeB